MEEAINNILGKEDLTYAEKILLIALLLNYEAREESLTLLAKRIGGCKEYVSDSLDVLEEKQYIKIYKSTEYKVKMYIEVLL